MPSEKEKAAERLEHIDRLLRELTKHTDALHEEMRVTHDERMTASVAGRADRAKEAQRRASSRAKRQLRPRRTS